MTTGSRNGKAGDTLKYIFNVDVLCAPYTTVWVCVCRCVCKGMRHTGRERETVPCLLLLVYSSIQARLAYFGLDICLSDCLSLTVSFSISLSLSLFLPSFALVEVGSQRRPSFGIVIKIITFIVISLNRDNFSAIQLRQAAPSLSLYLSISSHSPHHFHHLLVLCFFFAFPF